MTRPMLDGVELPQAQRIASEDEEVLAQHGVPALEGDFLQDLGRRAVRVTLTGVLTGPESGEDLKGLREKFHAAAPVPFVSDIGTATKVDKVLIEEMGVRELAGKTERFEYALSLREYTPPPAVTEEIPPIIPPPPVPVTATLVVEVIVEGEADFDFGRVRVTAAGTDADGGPVSRTLTNRVNNVWTETDFPPGSYTVEAAVDDPDPMLGSAPAEVREGETTEVTITLSRDRAEAIAKAFVVHFWFDKAFVEPCLREVLQRVVAYSDDHPDEKILIVGHTDLVGSDDYNQSLSERRGRSVHAYLTSRRSFAASVSEWNELRKPNPGGVTIRDTWGTREYQYMLQDLGYYKGNIDEQHGPATTAAVRDFQGDQGLTPSGFVDDATWQKLVEIYLEDDLLSIPEERFFPNAKGACNGGIVKWLGCGEQDPVLNTQDAWRPNRRTEILFIKADSIPCEVAKPVTFDLPAPGFVGTSWCLGPGNPAKRCCFLTRKEPQEGKWLVRPAEPAKVQVQGTITLADGTPVPNAKYALIAADGEYLHTDAQGKPDRGERPSGPQRGRPIPSRADAQGRFSHPVETPEGVYILELQELTPPQVARSIEDPPSSAVGNVVCFRLPSEPPGAVIEPGPSPAPAVDPLIEPADPVVVVSRSYTRPERTPITLRTSDRFHRKGTLTRSGNTAAVRLFTERTGGTEITFNGTDNVFSGGRLRLGVVVFAESDTPSGAVGDYQLTLTLAAGSTPVGPPATANVTAVRVTLDIFTTREPTGTNPQPFPQPPPTSPPPGTATDKWFAGGVVSVQDAARTQERVTLRVGPVEPAAFAGTLVLRQVSVNGDDVAASAGRAQLFDSATPAAGDTPLADPLEIPIAAGFAGRDVFVEGRTISAADRDTGFQLGVQGAADDGDRVALTVGAGVAITPAAALRAVMVRKPNTNPARQAFTLRSTAPLPATKRGTLAVTAASGSIRLFDAATGGTEISAANGNDSFPGDRLTAGVQVFAEGITPCTNLDDIRLLVTLGPGSPPAGVPGSLRLTAVEVTLDVGLTRTGPGVPGAPAPMPAADKVAIGRFIQVALPDNTHERPTLFVRPPAPAAFVCTLTLRSLAPPTVPGTPVQIFTQEVPAAGQTPVATPRQIPSAQTLAPGGVQLFAQATAASAAARDTGAQLGILGLDDDGDRVPMTAVQVEMTANTTAAAPALTFVRFGLWDNAFRANGTLFNNEAEADNFAGADSRRFHIRVRDASARGTGRVDANWRTRNGANNPLDAPATATVTLVETPANSGVFLSRGLLLVNDGDDQNQGTHTGLPGGAVAARGSRDHRIRLGNLLGSVEVDYPVPRVSPLVRRLPLFQRNPEERHRLPLQIFVLRGSGLDTSAASGIWTVDLRQIRECYGRFGIAVETVVAPGTPAADIVRNGADALVLITAPVGVSPVNVSLADEETLGTSFPALAATVRLFYTGGLASGNRGEAWPDTDFAGRPQQGACFVNRVAPTFNAAHEIGHVLIDKPVGQNGGHYVRPAAPANNRLHTNQNLMRNGTSVIEGVTESKRLWNAADTDAVNQFQQIIGRPSRYLRRF